MLDARLSRELDAYLDANWEEMLGDLQRLIRIDSVEDLARASEDAPYGPGPAAALEEALALWGEYGFEGCNLEGRIGYADWPGESKLQLGIIGHVDVVPVGDGWVFPPFQLSRKDGYLFGRGVADDKGPLLMALHAARFWKEKGLRFPYTIRFIIGNNEETGMRDLQHYQQRFEDPAVLFTPDDEFPVCYGEKGVLQGVLESGPIEGGIIEEWEGGMAVNAVPGTARAVLRADAAGLPEAQGISVKAMQDGRVQLCALGRQAHASTPELGRSAIKLLVEYILELGLCQGAELEWLQLVCDVVGSWDGSAFGLACESPDFGPLSMVGGVMGKRGGRFTQTVDVRFVQGIDPEDIVSALQQRAAACGAGFSVQNLMPVFLMEKDGPMVRTLLESYQDVTGDMQDSFTSAGATYARHFKMGASFGVEVHGSSRPDWVGGMHAANEGISEDSLKAAFKVYAVAIQRLMQLDFGALQG